MPSMLRSFLSIVGGVILAVAIVMGFGAKAWAIVGGAFVGAVAASWIAHDRRARAAYIVAALLLAATLNNLIAFSQPWWMWLAVLGGVPAAGWLAGRIAPADHRYPEHP